jgi:hypothetical protein
MKRELAKVLLDEIVRTRAQLVRLQIVLARRTEEKISRMDQCEECERFGKRTRQRRLSRFSSTRSSGRLQRLREVTQVCFPKMTQAV